MQTITKDWEERIAETDKITKVKFRKIFINLIFSFHLLRNDMNY